ncbi:hypothetical protein CHLRE_11g467708v5 [Chlamydomonas reinhardtii]|uniref:Uncharacterized protein n=1 Tax=Chlamydomonas reinhardtii TaxID=3055 RepID=A0A2K3D7S1_CHLRE|nr:uncharacterized protein CHLRE_11g467708v5 [Chlamydomonas reinhardtii]PNW76578.1 hypothetical protein CHLRE_11g467708v5 [Chlamydomonas reinhardtii]
MQFDPSKSNIPLEYNFSQPLEVSPAPANWPEGAPDGVMDAGPYVEFDPAGPHPADTYWKGPAPEGSFTLPNAVAQRTRLTPLRVPEAGAGGGAAAGNNNPLARLLAPFPREEYYAVEMDLHYGRELPRWVWQDGTLVFRPGFLTAPIDPDVPPYWLHRGIARFTLGRTDMAVQAVVGAAYLAFLAAVSAALYAVQPQLLAAVAVSWARNTLSLAKWGALLALAAADRVYLYWVFLAGKTVDQLLAKHAPPVRTFMWANAALWAVYLAVSPSGASLLPGVLA